MPRPPPLRPTRPSKPKQSKRRSVARSGFYSIFVATVEKRQLLSFVDFDAFGDDLVVGLVFDPEPIEAFDSFFVQFDCWHTHR